MAERPSSRTVHLALGSNLGNRLENLRSALGRIAQVAEVCAVSSVYLTPPVGSVAQPAFMNAACAVLWEHDLPALLTVVKRIEWELGRRPGPFWGPRPIDLDLLLAGEEVLDTPVLRVPHARLSERAFVLVPLAEIAASARHPVFDATMQELLVRLPADEREEVRLFHAVGWQAG